MDRQRPSGDEGLLIADYGPNRANQHQCHVDDVRHDIAERTQTCLLTIESPG